MATITQITTTELARRRGVTRQAILMAVTRGTLTPAATLDNGNYLFEPEPAREVNE